MRKKGTVTLYKVGGKEAKLLTRSELEEFVEKAGQRYKLGLFGFYLRACAVETPVLKVVKSRSLSEGHEG